MFHRMPISFFFFIFASHFAGNNCALIVFTTPVSQALRLESISAFRNVGCKALVLALASGKSLVFVDALVVASQSRLGQKSVGGWVYACGAVVDVVQ